MLALDLLGIPFTRAVHLRGQMPSVRTSMIGIKAGETKGFQQRFEPQENLVLTTPKHIRQDGTSVVIDGMPEPAWIPFVADKREQGDAGDYAAAGISSTSMSMSGYQRLKMAPNSPSSVFTRVCSNKCAPGLDHCICCFLQKRLLTT
jgi:hypothetical protein